VKKSVASCLQVSQLRSTGNLKRISSDEFGYVKVREDNETGCWPCYVTNLRQWTDVRTNVASTFF